MRTNVIIDEKSVAKAGKILGTKTKSATIRAAIDEVIRRKSLRQLAESSISHRHVDPAVLEKVKDIGWR